MKQESIQFIGVTPKQFQQDFLNETKSFITDLVLNQKPQESETYISRKQVSDLLGGVNEGTIINWGKKGILIEYGIGRLIRYKKSEVLSSLIKLNS